IYALHRWAVPLPWNRLAHALPQSVAGVKKKHVWIFSMALLIKAGLFISNFVFPPDQFTVSYFPTENRQATSYINFDNLFRYRKASYLTDRFLWDAQGRYERWNLNDHGYASDAHIVLSGHIQNPSDHLLSVQLSGSAQIRIAGTLFTS